MAQGMSIPAASAETLGGVKVGDGLNVAADGTISTALSMVYDADTKTLAITGQSGDCTELAFNGVKPSAVTYNQGDTEKVTYNGAAIWQKAAPTATVYAAATKCAASGNSSLARANQSTSYVGRATSSSPVGTCIKFEAPSGGWSQYGKAVLHVYRNGGSASANIRFGKLECAYADPLYCTQFYYGNYNAAEISEDVGAASCWVEVDISSWLPSGNEELAVTLMSKNAYCTIDGSIEGSTRAYIKLS